MRTLTLLVLAALALPAIVTVDLDGPWPSNAFAQPEDRRRAPTAAASPSLDPCIDGANDRMRAPSATRPGFDPRAPAPAGATAFTGIAPPGRDPSFGFPQPPQPGVTAQACTQRFSR